MGKLYSVFVWPLHERLEAAVVSHLQAKICTSVEGKLAGQAKPIHENRAESAMTRTVSLQ